MADVEPDGGESDCREEVAGELVIARGDSAEVFESVEEALNEVALAVELRLDRLADTNVALGGDVRGSATLLDERDDRFGKVASVADHVTPQAHTLKQVRHGRLVGGLPRAEHEAYRQAAGIDDDVDLGGQSAPRSSDGVIRAPFFPPAACWWARTMELSIR